MLTGVAVAKRRRDGRYLALAIALPLFAVAPALASKFNPWLSRFLIVPAALTAPLLGDLFRRRAVAAAIVVVATTTLGLALVRNELKPLDGAHRPWQLDQTQAVALTWKPKTALALERLDALVSSSACLGAALDTDEPSHLLYCARLGRRVTFLPLEDAAQAAGRAGLSYVVIRSVKAGEIARAFRQSG